MKRYQEHVIKHWMKLSSFDSLIMRFKRELTLYQRLTTHQRCPKLVKFFLGLAIAYALSPIDLIPDFIPVLGYLDDVIILPILLFIALRFIPEDLLKEVRLVMDNR